MPAARRGRSGAGSASLTLNDLANTTKAASISGIVNASGGAGGGGSASTGAGGAASATQSISGVRAINARSSATGGTGGANSTSGNGAVGGAATASASATSTTSRYDVLNGGAFVDGGAGGKCRIRFGRRGWGGHWQQRFGGVGHCHWQSCLRLCARRPAAPAVGDRVRAIVAAPAAPSAAAVPWRRVRMP